MKCNIVVNVDYVKVSVVNNCDWISVASFKYADTNSTVSIPIEYLEGADETCVSTSVGTITGNVLSIPVTTDNVTVTLSNAKCLVTVTNNDIEAISAITPVQQYVALGNTATFNISYNAGFEDESSKASVGTFSNSTLSVPTANDSIRINSNITPNMHDITILNNVPYIVPEFTSCTIRHNKTLHCDVVYGESSDYTCIYTNAGTISSTGFTVGPITFNATFTFNPQKVQVKVTSDVPWHVTNISPEIQYVIPGQTAKINLTYLAGYDPSDLCTTAGTISNGILSIQTKSTQTSADDYYVVANLYRGTNVLVELGNGSTSSDSCLPLSTYYNYSLSQQLYLATEIGDSDTIQSIAFNFKTDGNDRRCIYVYMENVDYTVLNQFNSVENASRVFSGFVDLSGTGWKTITLDTPFEYDSSKNLLITIYDYTRSWTKVREVYTYKPASSNYEAVYACNDQSTYDLSRIESLSYSRNLYKKCIQIRKAHVIPDEPEGPTTITIGTITGSGAISSTDIPIRNYSKHSMTEQIYLANEIGHSGSITDIAFYYNDTNAMTRTCEIYLLHTNKSSFTPYPDSYLSNDYVYPSASDLAFSGTVNFTKGWVTIHLDTPFTYNTSNNLCVIVYDKTGVALDDRSRHFIINQDLNSSEKTLRRYGSQAINITNATALAADYASALHERSVIQLVME